MEHRNVMKPQNKPERIPTKGATRQLEERLEDHNARLAFCEECIALLLAEATKSTADEAPMRRAKMLSRLNILAVVDHEEEPMLPSEDGS